MSRRYVILRAIQNGDRLNQVIVLCQASVYRHVELYKLDLCVKASKEHDLVPRGTELCDLRRQEGSRMKALDRGKEGTVKKRNEICNPLVMSKRNETRLYPADIDRSYGSLERWLLERMAATRQGPKLHSRNGP